MYDTEQHKLYKCHSKSVTDNNLSSVTILWPVVI